MQAPARTYLFFTFDKAYAAFLVSYWLILFIGKLDCFFLLLNTIFNWLTFKISCQICGCNIHNALKCLRQMELSGWEETMISNMILRR